MLWNVNIEVVQVAFWRSLGTRLLVAELIIQQTRIQKDALCAGFEVEH